MTISERIRKIAEGLDAGVRDSLQPHGDEMHDLRNIADEIDAHAESIRYYQSLTSDYAPHKRLGEIADHLSAANENTPSKIMDSSNYMGADRE